MFDSIVCMNVDKRFNQRPRLITEASRVGLNNIRFFTVGDGKTLKIPYDHVDVPNPPTRLRRQRRWFRRGTQGYNYFLGFRKILETARDSQWSNFLFLEDDIVFTENFREVFAAATDELKKISWDLFYLGASHRKAKTLQVANNLLRVNGSLCMHAVAFNRTSYKPMLEIPMENWLDLLVASRIHPKLNCFACWPNIVNQQDGFSVSGNRYSYKSRDINNQGVICTNLKELLRA